VCRYAVGEGEFAVGARLYGEVGQDVRVAILGGEGHDTGAEIARMDFGQSTESPDLAKHRRPMRPRWTAP